MTRRPPPEDLRLDPQRFYWALLDTSSLPKGARRPSRLGYLLEPLLPVPLESVHAAFVPADPRSGHAGRARGGRVLACAMDREQLAGAATGNTASLGPASLPPFIDAIVNPAGINLLTGEFEPPPVRSARRAWAARLVLCLLLATALVASGAHRRIAAEDARAQAARLAAHDLLDQVLPPAGGTPPEARLIGELRSLRRTRAAAPADLAPFDAPAKLQTLLARWPEDLHARADSITIAPEAVVITALIPSHEQAQALAAALGTLPGWRAEQPRTSAQRGGREVRLTLRFTPEPAS